MLFSHLQINSETEASYTFKQLQQEAECLAGHLIEQGLKSQDIVIFYSSNCLEFIVMMIAVWRAGGIIALMNAMATAGDTPKLDYNIYY